MLRVPQVLGEADSEWAEPSDPTSSIPKLGDIVWAQFSGGDVTKPVYIANALGQLKSSTFVSGPPGSTPNEPGDVWWQLDDTGNVVAQWEGLGGTLWVERTLSYAAIAFIEAATITVGTLSVSGSINSPQVVPTGAISMFGSATAPAGYLSCDGSSQLRASYAALYAVIGVSFGSVDGTHFNLPNFSSKFPMGSTPGATGGAASHTHTGVDHLHSQTDHQHVVAAHSHGLTAGHARAAFFGNALRAKLISGIANWVPDYVGTLTVTSNATLSGTAIPLGGNTDVNNAYWTDGQTTAVTTGAADRSLTTGASSSLPPYTGVNFIIKT
jgi:microcystin-dependent protein